MNRLEALKELLAKVEADDIDALPDNCFRHAFAGMPTAGIGFNFSEAHEGSLDAAKALHEAVLPGWVYAMMSNHDGIVEAGVGPDDRARGVGKSGNPARAWLIAILKALIAQEQAA